MGAADKSGALRASVQDGSEVISSTHNELRLAACPLSGVPGRVRAPVN